MEKKEKIYSILIIVLTGLSLVPLIILCKYNHPSADDFNYSIATFHEWNSSHSIWKLIGAAIDTSKNFYNSWQGLYSSAFFLALQPAIFGEKYYIVTGIIMLSIIVFSTCFFFAFLTKKIMGASLLEGVVIGSAASFLMIQFMPSCVQGLYWYNGAINYGLFYAIFLMLICSMISLYGTSNKKDTIKMFFTCCLLGFLLEGGNHVTAFMGLLSVFCFMIIEIVQKRKGKIIGLSIILLFMTMCFLTNILSPGTKIRQAGLNEYKMNFVHSIKNAVLGGIKNINSWLDLAPIIIVILVMPIFLKLIKNIRNKYNFRFTYPFLVFVLSIAWICIMYCPPVYAMGYLGEGRLHNIVYFNFIILFFANIFYFTGWILCNLSEQKEIKHSYINMTWICCMAVLLIGLWISNWDSSWSAEAISKLKYGEPQWYSQQAYERHEKLLNSAGQDVIVEEYSVKPEILFFDDITDNPEDWRNSSVKGFYDLNSIVIENTGGGVLKCKLKLSYALAYIMLKTCSTFIYVKTLISIQFCIFHRRGIRIYNKCDVAKAIGYLMIEEG